jgi:hypothetical protein
MIQLTILQWKLVGTYVYVGKLYIFVCRITPSFLGACPSVYILDLAEALPSAGDQVSYRVGLEES